MNIAIQFHTLRARAEQRDDGPYFVFEGIGTVDGKEQPIRLERAMTSDEVAEWVAEGCPRDVPIGVNLGGDS